MAGKLKNRRCVWGECDASLTRFVFKINWSMVIRNGVKPLAEPMPIYYQLVPWEQTSIKQNSNMEYFFQENALQKCRLHILAIFFLSQNGYGRFTTYFLYRNDSQVVHLSYFSLCLLKKLIESKADLTQWSGTRDLTTRGLPVWTREFLKCTGVRSGFNENMFGVLGVTWERRSWIALVAWGPFYSNGC